MQRELLGVPQRHPLAPRLVGSLDGLLFGPTRPADPLDQVVELLLGDLDAERDDVVGSIVDGHVGHGRPVLSTAPAMLGP